MKSASEIGLIEGRRVLLAEAHALEAASKKVGIAFSHTLEILSKIKGKVIATGVGKSGIIGRRMASIFSSTGTPAFFMHPVEGVHGDIGIIGKDDAIIMITHSGKSDELMNLLPHIKRHGIPVILVSRDNKSSLSSFADVVLETGVSREACPYNLVPTTSSAVASGLGDALAIALMRIKGFKQKDYKNSHPGGDLGKRLLYKAEDLMTKGNSIPIVSVTLPVADAVEEISAKGLGMACVVDAKGKIFGVLTDGDIRRAVGSGLIGKSKAGEICTRSPKTIKKDLLAVEALSIMEKFKITSLIVTGSGAGKGPLGILHMHQILRAGVV
ncbi:MAG: KpsF/GutQ family sugar-phosphate isomerase [Fibrobacteres bacterium]|nr:KpsF/GutQ family sugar-phosphate isomerase [Fibrobacterota bacterium]